MVNQSCRFHILNSSSLFKPRQPIIPREWNINLGIPLIIKTEFKSKERQTWCLGLVQFVLYLQNSFHQSFNFIFFYIDKMVLESTIICIGWYKWPLNDFHHQRRPFDLISAMMTSLDLCFFLDNSEYSRNGDSNPTRLWAQRDAANFIARGKLRDNPENDVGIVQMNNHNVIASLTSDTGRLNTVLSKIVSDGSGKSFLYSRAY